MRVRRSLKDPFGKTDLSKPGREHWLSDESVTECCGCGISFSLLTRRHHCRACGFIFCGECSKHEVVFTVRSRRSEEGYIEKKKRVCEPCHDKIQRARQHEQRDVEDTGAQSEPEGTKLNPCRAKSHRRARSVHVPRTTEQGSWNRLARRSQDLTFATLTSILSPITPRGGARVFSKDDLEPIDDQGTFCESEMSLTQSDNTPEHRRRSTRRHSQRFFTRKRWSLSRKSEHDDSSTLLNYLESLEELASIPHCAILGEGQYGVVWRARSKRTREWCAVKTFKTGQQSENLLKHEQQIADAVLRLPHPCLVKLLSAHLHDDGRLRALVMEFCSGGDLQQRITALRAAAHKEERQYVPPLEASRWIAEIFLGLEHLHLQMDLIFRDLKPGNVVFTAAGCAKITDFGMSRSGLKSTGVWTFGFPAGSPGYIAPEILEQEEYGYSADFYSLGVVIWVMQTGGVTDREEPSPPRSAIDEEWCLLEQCIAEPAENNALPLVEPARGLVQLLTLRSPHSRPSHTGVREHVFMTNQALPPPNASREVLEAWTRTAEVEHSGASSSSDNLQRPSQFVEATHCVDDRSAGQQE